MKLLPVILGIVGIAGGAAAGHFLKPAELSSDDKMAMAAGDPKSGKQDGKPAADKQVAKKDHDHDDDHKAPATALSDADYVKLNKQFVVPIVEGERVSSLIVISMALEADQGLSETIFQFEPKIRDEFLSVLFKHAQSGGFTGVFTADQPMQDLRSSLLYAAQSVLGRAVRSVLVTDIVRQDI